MARPGWVSTMPAPGEPSVGAGAQNSGSSSRSRGCSGEVLHAFGSVTEKLHENAREVALLPLGMLLPVVSGAAAWQESTAAPD